MSMRPKINMKHFRRAIATNAIATNQVSQTDVDDLLAELIELREKEVRLDHLAECFEAAHGDPNELRWNKRKLIGLVVPYARRGRPSLLMAQVRDCDCGD